MFFMMVKDRKEFLEVAIADGIEYFWPIFIIFNGILNMLLLRKAFIFEVH